jgi:hypothetical protein
VRNERNVLAAVAGHPFITTMIASFQDHDSLYMLVWLLLLLLRRASELHMLIPKAARLLPWRRSLQLPPKSAPLQ